KLGSLTYMYVSLSRLTSRKSADSCHLGLPFCTKWIAWLPSIAFAPKSRGPIPWLRRSTQACLNGLAFYVPNDSKQFVVSPYPVVKRLVDPQGTSLLAMQQINRVCGEAFHSLGDLL